MGALSAKILKVESAGSEKKIYGTLAFGSSYNNSGSDNTTGESCSAQLIGLVAVSTIRIAPKRGFIFEPLYSASGADLFRSPTFRVKVYRLSTAAEVVNATDLSALSNVRFECTGI